MNITGTVLERTNTNKIYVKFKEQIKESEDELYEWKCYILKKYFHDNILVSVIRMIIGIILLILSASSSLLKIVGHQRAGSLILIVCLVLGVVFTGSGIMFSFSNYKCLKKYKDYLWDDENNSEIAHKIIKFYDKAH